MTSPTPSEAEARELLSSIRFLRETTAREGNCESVFVRAGLLRQLLDLAESTLATLPPQDSSGDARELVERLRGHAMGLKENGRYDPARPSGLTNADAVSYGGLLEEAATAIEAALSRQDRPEGVMERARRAAAEVFRDKAAKLAKAPFPNAAAIALVCAQASEFESGKRDDSEEVAIALAALASRSAPDGWVVRKALVELQQAESTYRLRHAALGCGHSDTGRAWDLMKRASKKARQALAASPSPPRAESASTPEGERK